MLFLILLFFLLVSNILTPSLVFCLNFFLLFHYVLVFLVLSCGVLFLFLSILFIKSFIHFISVSVCSFGCLLNGLCDLSSKFSLLPSYHTMITFLEYKKREYHFFDTLYTLIIFCFYFKISLWMCTYWAYFWSTFSNNYMSAISAFPYSISIFAKY